MNDNVLILLIILIAANVILVGVAVVTDGVHTGATPGRALRLGRD